MHSIKIVSSDTVEGLISYVGLLGFSLSLSFHCIAAVYSGAVLITRLASIVYL